MQRSHFADSYPTNHPSETTGDDTPVDVRNGNLYPVPTEQIRSRSWSDPTPPVMFRGTFMCSGNDVPTQLSIARQHLAGVLHVYNKSKMFQNQVHHLQ